MKKAALVTYLAVSGVSGLLFMSVASENGSEDVIEKASAFLVGAILAPPATAAVVILRGPGFISQTARRALDADVGMPFWRQLIGHGS